ncbi:putative polysaccharide biosynthesis protein [Anaerospora hongkongensis]
MMSDSYEVNSKTRTENVKEENSQQESRGSQFFKGTLILTAAGIVVKGIGSLNWIFLSRVLGGEGIGIYQMAFPLYLLALSISSAGIPVAISIITAEKVAYRDYRGATRVFHLSFILLIVTGLVLSLLLYFGAGWLIEQRIIRDPRAYYSLIALSPAIFLVTLISSFRGYLQGWQLMTPTAVSQIVEQLFRVAAMLVFASLLLPKGLAFAAGGASLGAGAGAAAALVVLAYYYLRLKRYSHPKIQTEAVPVHQERGAALIRRIAKLALPVSLSSIMLPLVANLDLLVVPLRLEKAGYSVEQATELFGYLTGMAVPLVNLATLLTAALATSLVPTISRVHSLGASQDIFYRTAGAMRLANIATIPFGVMLWVLAKPVLSVIYHAPGAAEATRVLAGGVFLLGIHQVTTGVLQGLGRTSIPVINMGVSALVKVVLNWTLTAIPALGIQGAAWATLVDIGIAAALNLYFVHRYTGFFLNAGDLLKNIGAAIVMGGVMYFLYDPLVAIAQSELLVIGLTALGGGLAYGGIMIVTGGLTKRDVERIPYIGAILKKCL